MQRVYDAKVKIWGRDDGKTLQTLGYLADTKKFLRKLADAEQLYVDLLTRRRRSLGPDDEFTMWAELTLLDCLLAQLKFAEARPLHAKLLPRAKRVLGPSHDLTCRVQRFSPLLA